MNRFETVFNVVNCVLLALQIIVHVQTVGGNVVYYINCNYFYTAKNTYDQNHFINAINSSYTKKTLGGTY